MIPGILSRLNATIYCRIREAIITRQQIVPTSLYRSSALSLCSLHSMVTISNSNVVLGDVYADGSISSCGSVLDFTKPGVVYYRDRTHKGCVRANVNLRRLKPLNGSLCFGCSIFDATRRVGDLSLLHGSWLKNFSTSSSACCSAQSTGAAQDVSFDGSSPNEQLASSSLSPDLYVIAVLYILNSVSA